MTQEFLNEKKLTFRCCTREEQHILLNAHLDGESEAFTHPVWEEVRNTDLLNYSWVLRTKPIKRLAIPWEHIKPMFKFAAMSKNNTVTLYTHKPVISFEDGDSWVFQGSCMTVFALNIDVTGIDWRDSLVERPADK